MKYAKLIYNALQFAPKVLRVDGRTYINPDGETLEQYGYLPLAESIMPMADEGCKVVATGWEVKNGYIVQTWGQVPVVKPPKRLQADLRREAYETDADIFARAYIGYMLEGNEAKAAEAKARYLEAKQFIREQYPDEVTK